MSLKPGRFTSASSALSWDLNLSITNFFTLRRYGLGGVLAFSTIFHSDWSSTGSLQCLTPCNLRSASTSSNHLSSLLIFLHLKVLLLSGLGIRSYLYTWPNHLIPPFLMHETKSVSPYRSLSSRFVLIR